VLFSYYIVACIAIGEQYDNIYDSPAFKITYLFFGGGVQTCLFVVLSSIYVSTFVCETHRVKNRIICLRLCESRVVTA
jgi:hypothetical protein